VDVIISPPVTMALKAFQVVDTGRARGLARPGRLAAGPRLDHRRCEWLWSIRTGAVRHRTFVHHVELANPGGLTTATVDQHFGHAPHDAPGHGGRSRRLAAPSVVGGHARVIRHDVDQPRPRVVAQHERRTE